MEVRLHLLCEWEQIGYFRFGSKTAVIGTRAEWPAGALYISLVL